MREAEQTERALVSNCFPHVVQRHRPAPGSRLEGVPQPLEKLRSLSFVLETEEHTQVLEAVFGGPLTGEGAKG